MSVAVPVGHPLASRYSVSFVNVDGPLFLVYEQIGFWMNVVERNLSTSQIIVLIDRFVFESPRYLILLSTDNMPRLLVPRILRRLLLRQH